MPDIARFAFPVLVTVKPCAAELPSFTLPKLRLLGLTLIADDAAIAVPLSATVAGVFGALLTIEIDPLAVPAVCGAYCALKFPLCPGASVIGNAIPLKLNPVPVTVACETTRLAVPVFLSCTVCELVFPVTTDPKLALPGVMLNPACTPVPTTASVATVPSLLVTVTVPLAAPLAVGAYCTPRLMLCDGARVTGAVNPLADIPEPLAVTCVTVSLEFPVFETCTFCVALLPIFTFPKFTLVGENARVCEAATPVPLSATVTGLLGALLTIETDPLAFPAACGAYCTLKLPLCPGVNVSGNANPLELNPAPVTAA
jgi:hypothetical protein